MSIEKWTDIEKIVFAGIMGCECGFFTGDLNYNPDFKLEPTPKNPTVFIKDNSPVCYCKNFNPIDYFTAILKGLTPEQRLKATDIFGNNKGFRELFCGIDDLKTYLWIDSHKAEILRAVLDVVGEGKTP